MKQEEYIKIQDSLGYCYAHPPGKLCKSLQYVTPEMNDIIEDAGSNFCSRHVCKLE